MEQENTAVAPPTSVQPAIGINPNASTEASAPVATNFDPKFAQIVNDSHVSTPEARANLAKNISTQIEETKDFHPNAQIQPGKMFISLLQGKVGEAYKWFNGGGVRQDEARDMHGNLYYKEANERGFNGRILDRKGNVLSEKQMEELEANGGVFTDTDQKALKTLPWVNGQSNAKLINDGLANKFGVIVNNAYNSARISSTANKNITEQISLVQKNPKIYNRIAELPSAQRAELFGLTQQYLTNGATQGAGNEKKASVNTGTNNSNTNNANVGGNLGVPGGKDANGQAVLPPKMGVEAGAGSSNTAGNTGNVNVGEVNSANNSSSNTAQVQANQRALIERRIQEIIGGPEAFKDYIRVQALNAENEANMKNIPLDALPPGATDLAKIDPSLIGPEKMIATLIAQQRNNALLAARNEQLFAAARKASSSGKLADMDINLLDKQFTNSEIYKAIDNTYNHRAAKALNFNYQPTMEEGHVMVDDHNNIHVYRNGKLEKKQ